MKPVRIGYDASSTVGQRTGIGICAAHLLSAMTEKLPDNWTISAFVNSAKHPLPAADPWVVSPKIRIRHTKLPGRLLMRSWQYLHAPPIEMFLGGIDLHHSPASYVTPTIVARRVITVHDLFFLQQQDPSDQFGGQYFEKTFPAGLPKADRIITCSAYTRGEILSSYAVHPDRVVVVHHGYEERHFNLARRPDDADILERLSHGRPYLLCVSSTGPSPRKNLGQLLEAYARARSLDTGLPQLLIAGHAGTEVEQREFNARLDRLKMTGHVRRTGYLTPDQLAALYRGAQAMIMPSLCEGFGLPVIEAMACGCPVMAANAGSLPEVAGDSAILIDITSTQAMAVAMVKVCGDAALRGQLKGRGIERAKGFSWKSSARKTLEIYAEVLEKR